MSSNRGQSEVVGVILLTAVMVILIALVSGFVLSSVDTTNEPTLSIAVGVESGTFDLAHDGGDALGATDTVVIVGQDGTRISLDEFPEPQGDGDGRFEPGEIRNHSHSASDVLRIDVVHEPTNTLVHSDVYDTP